MVNFLKNRFWWIRYFLNGINNIIRWIPILYNDREWDQTYLYKILGFKLKQMEEYYKEGKHHTLYRDKTIKQLTIARILCDRLVEDDYIIAPINNIEKIYGKRDFLNEFEEVDINGRKMFEWKPKYKDGEEKARKRAYNHSEYMRKQDLEYLCKLINKHSNSWWD